MTDTQGASKKYCTKCGNALERDALFCDMCGAKQKAASDPIITAGETKQTFLPEPTFTPPPELTHPEERPLNTRVDEIISGQKAPVIGYSTNPETTLLQLQKNGGVPRDYKPRFDAIQAEVRANHVEQAAMMIEETAEQLRFDNFLEIAAKWMRAAGELHNYSVNPQSGQAFPTSDPGSATTAQYSAGGTTPQNETFVPRNDIERQFYPWLEKNWSWAHSLGGNPQAFLSAGLRAGIWGAVIGLAIAVIILFTPVGIIGKIVGLVLWPLLIGYFWASKRWGMIAMFINDDWSWIYNKLEQRHKHKRAAGWTAGIIWALFGGRGEEARGFVALGQLSDPNELYQFFNGYATSLGGPYMAHVLRTGNIRLSQSQLAQMRFGGLMLEIVAILITLLVIFSQMGK